MTAAMSWTNEKKKTQKHSETGLSDEASDYPTPHQLDYPTHHVGSNSDRIQNTV